MRIFLPSLRKWCAEAHPTDIESSTTLAQQYPEALPILLTRHNLILNEAITPHNGQVFWISGDAFCAAFQTARDALDAALAAQLAARSVVSQCAKRTDGDPYRRSLAG